MLGTLLATAVLCLASVVVGAGLLRLSGLPARAGYGPAIGFAALIVVCNAALKHEGRADTAVVLVALLLVATAIAARGRLLHRPPAELVGAALVVLALCLVPFAAYERFGLLGMGVNNDLSSHLALAEALNTEAQALPLGIGGSYPLGPHAVVTTLAQVLGLGVDQVFTALLIAVALLTVPAALTALNALTRPRRALGAVLVALPYLVASYYGQAAFKETVQALFVLVFALLLRELVRLPAFRLRTLVPVGVLAAACVANYSYFGLGWPVATLAVWLGLELLAGDLRPRSLWRGLRGRLDRRTLLAAGAVVLVLAAVLAPEAGRALRLFEDTSFSPASSGTIAANQRGNLVDQLSPYEATGVWPEEDFRVYPRGGREAVRTGVLAAVGVLAVAFGLLWWARRRERQFLAAALAAGAIYLVLRGSESPYVTAKSLVILSPLLVLLAVGALLGRWRARPGELQIARWALTAVFAAGVLVSSFVALRHSQVAPRDIQEQLARFQDDIAGKPTLFLGYDEFQPWYLKTAPTSDPAYRVRIRVGPRAEKPPGRLEGRAANFGPNYDFDTPLPVQLDRFAFVITSSSAYQSEPPPNFRERERTDMFVLWERRGRTPARRILNEGSSPGAVLDCSTPEGRALSQREGFARVLPRPVVTGIKSWRYVPPGGRVERQLDLPPGRWALAAQYTSPIELLVTGPGLTDRLAGTQSRSGPFWPVGEVRASAGGETVIQFRGDRPNRLTPDRAGATVAAIAAVRTDVPRLTVPLGRACGRYVDWYTLGRERPAVAGRGS